MTSQVNGISSLECKHEGQYKIVCVVCGKSFDEYASEEDLVMFKAEREGLNRIIQTLRKYQGFVANDDELAESIILLERQRDALL